MKAVLFKFGRYFLLALAVFLGLIGLASMIQLDYAGFENTSIQQTFPVRYYSPSIHAYNYKKLKRSLGSNTSLPPGYELQALLALQHYPQLAKERIHFVIEPETLPLASRPALWSILLPKRYWRYYIIISNESKLFTEAMLFEKLPFNAQVGILGHELAHTLHYQDKTAWEMLWMGLCYGSTAYRIRFEQATDSTTIAQGLGWQLYDFARFIRSSKHITVEEKQWLDKYYLNDRLIMAAMQKHPAYSSP